MNFAKNQLICSILAILAIFSSCQLYTSNKEKPIAKKGILDLRNWSFDKDGNIPLNGQWEFYWNQLLEPEDFKNNKQEETFIIKVPDSWGNYSVNNTKLESYGYATYRITILTKSISEVLKLAFRNPFPATKCYVNGEMIGYSGIVGKSYESSIGEYNMHYKAFEVKGDTIELIIQIADYYYHAGGLFAPFEVGTSKQIKQSKKRLELFSNLQLGCFLIMTIYHLLLFFLYRKDKSTLYFALSTFGFTLYFIFLYNLPSVFAIFINMEIIMRLFLVTTNLIMIGLLLFIYSLFPKIFKSIVIKIIVYFHLIIFLLAFTPLNFFIRISSFTQLYTFLAIIYSIIVIAIAFIKKKDDSGSFLLGILVLFTATINDALNYMNVINTLLLLDIGLLIFFIFQSYIISARFSRAFVLSEKQAVELKDLNENLEHKVAERIIEIEQQKEEIQHLNATKDKFFSIIAHDLKNLFNAIINISSVLGTGGNMTISEQQKHIDLMLSAGQNGYKLLENLLLWSRSQTGRIAFSPKLVNVAKLVKDVKKLFDSQAFDKKILVSADVNEELTVYCDIEMTRLVLRNLISNAIKFTYIGGRVKIYAALREIPGSKLCFGKVLEFKISDTGVGISKENIDNLFRQDVNISTNGTNKERGSGLGLILCKEFINYHKGELTVDSEVGKGSTFRFFIPQD